MLYRIFFLIVFLVGIVWAQDNSLEKTGVWNREEFRAENPWQIPVRLPQKEARYLRKMEGLGAEMELKVFLGFWCSDSEDWIPVLVKGLEEFPDLPVEYIGLNRKKEGAERERNQYQITHLPTIILLKNGVETGRITETPASGILWKEIAGWLKSE